MTGRPVPRDDAPTPDHPVPGLPVLRDPARGAPARTSDPAGRAPAAGAELLAGYARAGFGNRLGWGERPALLLVDLMRVYFTPGSPLDLGSREVLGPCARLLAAARGSAVPVLHSRVEYAPGVLDGGLFVRKIAALRLLAVDAPGGLGALEPDVAPAPGEVVLVKQYASAFAGTSLAATLTAAGVDTVVVAGVSTSGCIRATATDAVQHGFRPMVPRDACADRDPAVHEANLFDLDAKYADVVDTAEACRHLRRPEA